MSKASLPNAITATTITRLQLPLPQHTVVRLSNVGRQLRDLLKQLVLCQVPPPSRCRRPLGDSSSGGRAAAALRLIALALGAERGQQAVALDALLGAKVFADDGPAITLRSRRG